MEEKHFSVLSQAGLLGCCHMRFPVFIADDPVISGGHPDCRCVSQLLTRLAATVDHASAVGSNSCRFGSKFLVGWLRNFDFWAYVKAGTGEKGLRCA